MAKHFAAVFAALLLALPLAAWAQEIKNPPPSAAVISVMGGLPHVADNATLAAAPNALYSKGVFRDHYATGGVADGPLFFTPQTGTCASNGWVNDGGNCVDSTSGDGNSWKALHKYSIFDLNEFNGNAAALATAATAASAVNTDKLTLIAPLSVLAPFPASFGSAPTDFLAVDTGNYPATGKIPQGVFEQFETSLVIPSSYAGTPWPNVNHASYIENDATAGQTSVNYFGASFVTSTGPSVFNFNGVVSNTPATNGFSASGLGRNFTVLVGLELDTNIWKVGGAAPSGTLDALRIIGGGDATIPLGGATGIHFYPLSNFGGPSPTPWSYNLYSEDAASADFASIGATGTGNNVPSQSVIYRARTSGGSNNNGTMLFSAAGAFELDHPLIVNDPTLTHATDVGAAFLAHVATGENFEVRPHFSLSSGISITAPLDDLSANEPIEFIGPTQITGAFNVIGAVTLSSSITFSSSTTGAGTQTFTNSPCSGLTSEAWIPALITGKTGTWYIPACQ